MLIPYFAMGKNFSAQINILRMVLRCGGDLVTRPRSICHLSVFLWRTHHRTGLLSAERWSKQWVNIRIFKINAGALIVHCV